MRFVTSSYDDSCLTIPSQVKAAAEQALAELKQNNPDTDTSAIKVDLPKALPVPTGPGGIHYHVVLNQNVSTKQSNIAGLNTH